MATDLCFASAAEIGPLLRRRELSVVEVVTAAIERADAVDPLLNSLITLARDRALSAARDADREFSSGHDRGPLHGVPFTLKDIYATRGVRTTSGSKVFAETIPSYDSTAAVRLADAGAVLLAKCNTNEFACGADNRNVHYGDARNPWDRDRVPGGSSGGSAAAVAAGIGVFSLGTDTGGSVRMPAALCGVVGLKPTAGRVSTFGITPVSWSLDTCGPLTRSVRDAAFVLEAIAGRDPNDPGSSARSVDRYAAGLDGDVRGLRVAVPREYFWDGLDPEVETATRVAIRTLADLGAEVEEISMPWGEHAIGAGNLITLVEIAAYHARYRAKWRTDYGPEILKRTITGTAFDAADYVLAQQVRRAVTERTWSLYKRFDLLATATCPVPAPLIEANAAEGLDAAASAGASTPVVVGRLNRLGSVTGFPAISVPSGLTRSGLPVGLQLMAAPFQERRLLDAALAYEQATTWHLRRPALAT